MAAGDIKATDCSRLSTLHAGLIATTVIIILPFYALGESAIKFYREIERKNKCNLPLVMLTHI